MTADTNGVAAAWRENVRLQFENVNVALVKLDGTVMDLIVKVAVLEALRGPNADTARRHERDIREGHRDYVELVWKIAPWLAIGALMVNEVFG